eukprot:Hpha_TRINITY_DN11966_c0_g2::TRINITY_DN11966_c0_g2_i1::g.20813::m.20813
MERRMTSPGRDDELSYEYTPSPFASAGLFVAKHLWSMCYDPGMSLARSLPLPGYHSVMWREEGNETDKRLFLTLDDAPGRDLPAMFALLDLLRDAGVCVTFFIISSHIRGEEGERWMRQAVEDGHAFGNHLVEDRPGPSSAQEFEELLNECEQAIERFVPGYGARPKKFFRAPCGIMRSAWPEVLSRRRYVSVLGDVYGNDPLLGPYDPEFVANFMGQRAKPGSILILHVPDPCSRIPRDFLPIFRMLIPSLRGSDFRLLPLDDATVPAHSDLSSHLTD